MNLKDVQKMRVGVQETINNLGMIKKIEDAALQRW